MEVKRTVPVKLDVPEERRDDLHQTIQQFNTAANHTIDHGRDEDGDLILNKSTIHDEVYHDLRDVTDLPANLVVRAYSKAVEAMKSTVAEWEKGNSRPLPSFDEPSAVYLHVVVQKGVDQRDGDRVLGVDLNLKNVAVTSTGQFFDGGELLWGQNHYFRVRRSLQDKGTRSARQALRRLSGRENRFVLNRLHNISRGIVEDALRHNCSYIAVEDLTHIRERMDASDGRLKRQMHNWAFRELQEQIAYKAAEYGIRVESVNPAFSSQTCSKCGHQSSTNRDKETGWFACNECGYEVDGDHNAAKNVGLRLLALLSGKRPDGLGNGQLALKSGTLNVSDVSHVYSSLEFERESTDKPTASAVAS